MSQNLILVYDSETSGMVLWDKPSEDPAQPHIVQLAACLVDSETRKTIQAIDLIIKPEGWTIPDEVSKIHGITTEYASEVGISESLAVGVFLELWEKCDFRVGHNEQFDSRIIRIALMRVRNAGLIADSWKAGKAECTAKLATPYCKLPPTDKMKAAGRHHYKTCKLEEAYQAFFRRPMLDAHSAMGDVQACMAVYWAIKDREANTEAALNITVTEEEDFQI